MLRFGNIAAEITPSLHLVVAAKWSHELLVFRLRLLILESNHQSWASTKRRDSEADLASPVVSFEYSGEDLMNIADRPQGELPQEAINGRLYRKANLVQTYSNRKLYPAEAAALIRYQQDVIGKRVLDLGCGAGRLAIYLRPLTNDYVGMDVSHHMVEHCHRTLDGLQFVQGDMRNLAAFESESIDTVIAISNLFDAVSHEERLVVLGEVRRVMRLGGLLIFSSHNRNYANIGARPQLEFHRNPFTQVRTFLSFLQATINHRRAKKHQRIEPEFALVNDSGNNYASLHYYVQRDVQAKQLASIGFRLIECLDEQGFTLNPVEDDSTNASIQYIARREI